MEDDIQKTPLVDLITEISRLDQQIDLLILKYEKLRLEVVRRYPMVDNTDGFVKKIRK